MWTPMFESCASCVGMLIDTDVLIWFLRGQSSARDAIRECRSVELSAVTCMELVQGVRDKEELRIGYAGRFASTSGGFSL